MAEFTHTVPSGSRIVVVVSTGPLDDDFREKMESDNIRMPDVMGKSQGLALEELAALKFKPRVIYDYNDNIIKGSVMDQHPAAGALSSPELESLLLVSSGPSINERVQVNLPDVVGMSQEEASAKLKDAGLSPQIVHYKSSSVQKGIVSAQIPDTASLVAQPEVKSKIVWVIIAVIITALLGLGYFVYNNMNLTAPPPVEVVVTTTHVPNLIGLTEDEAVRELQKANLILGEVSVAAPEDSPIGAIPGTVIGSTPDDGDEVLEGSPVSLVLAGDEREITDLTIVPDVVGMDEYQMVDAFEGITLVMSVVRGPHQSVPAGQVIMQSPAAGTEVPQDSVVVIAISSGEAAEPVFINLVDVTGLPVSEAAEILQSYGLVVTLPLGDDMASGAVTTMTPHPDEQVLVGSVVILNVEGNH